MTAEKKSRGLFRNEPNISRLQSELPRFRLRGGGDSCALSCISAEASAGRAGNCSASASVCLRRAFTGSLRGIAGALQDQRFFRFLAFFCALTVLSTIFL